MPSVEASEGTSGSEPPLRRIRHARSILGRDQLFAAVVRFPRWFASPGITLLSFYKRGRAEFALYSAGLDVRLNALLTRNWNHTRAHSSSRQDERHTRWYRDVAVGEVAAAFQLPSL